MIRNILKNTEVYSLDDNNRYYTAKLVSVFLITNYTVESAIKKYGISNIIGTYYIVSDKYYEIQDCYAKHTVWCVTLDQYLRLTGNLNV